MSEAKWVAPSKIEKLFEAAAGNKFASVNSAEAGARTQEDLPKGDKPYQLYSLGTPNGVKIGIMLEELGVEYDAYTINIMKGDQFKSGFVDINPNSKIPAMLDQSAEPEIRLFESGSILMYLADKHKKFIPPMEEPAKRAEVINWLMWQMGSAPYFGQFGHFYRYAPADQVEARNYGVARYGMEVQRLLSVLDKHLAASNYMCGNDEADYSIADIAIYPWVTVLFHPQGYNAKEFLSTDKYTNVLGWVDRISKRPAVQAGEKVTPFGS
eukprot:augustus_masked-scaffold_5-processed-gene-16.26-mRNA-1 protein AED:0.32 eAED:0.32 QI:0/-1/0/1/-1/1/1/0/267